MKWALAALAAVGVVLALMLLNAVLSQLDPLARAEAQRAAALRMAQREALAPLWLIVKRIGLVTLAVALMAGAAGAVAGTLLAWITVVKARTALGLIYPKNGLYPAVVQSAASGLFGAPAISLLPAPNEPRSQVVAALVNGNLDRIPSGAMRPILRPEPETALLPDPEPTLATNVSASDLLAGYDPQREPHWLLIGQTGSGKSHAVFAIAGEIARRYPSEFLVAERGGIDWNQQADARTVDGYATLLATVEEERQRRVELMRAADVNHVSGLPDPQPLLVLIIEEAESAYGRLFELDRARGRQFMATLRDLASQGRKQGIVLIVATQTGTSGVFDAPTRRNLGNTLIFRSEAIVGDQWGVPRTVGLPGLSSGVAYALRYACTVPFPMSERPQLPKSQLYHEPDDPLKLAADAEADGLGEYDLPDGPTVGTVATAYNSYNCLATRGVTTVGERLPRRQPDPAEAEAMRQHYQRTGSKTSTCMRFYGYKDADTWEYVNLALEGRL